MKIGILTFHNTANHGAFLQAYALLRCLKEMGFADPQVINYRSWRGTSREYRAHLTPKNPLRLPGIVGKILKFKTQARLLNLTERVFTEDALAKMRFDAIIIGSDSVWNYTNELDGFDPVYFSQGLNARRILTYAASCGPDSLTGAIPPTIPNLLRKIDWVSVRDENSKSFYQKLVKGREANLVLDPVFLHAFTREALDPQRDDYILVYGFGFSPDLIANVSAKARRLGMKTVSVAHVNKWCDENVIALSPFEWLGYLNEAKYFVTSMYHGMLFAVKFNLPFCAYVSKYRENKMRDFLERYDLSAAMILEGNRNEDAALRTMFGAGLDYGDVNRKIEEHIRTSKSFLRNALTS